MSNPEESAHDTSMALGATIRHRVGLILLCSIVLSSAWTLVLVMRTEDVDKLEALENSARLALIGAFVGFVLGSRRITTIGRAVIVGAMMGPFIPMGALPAWTHLPGAVDLGSCNLDGEVQFRAVLW